jgi:hypothetical protein
MVGHRRPPLLLTKVAPIPHRARDAASCPARTADHRPEIRQSRPRASRYSPRKAQASRGPRLARSDPKTRSATSASAAPAKTTRSTLVRPGGTGIGTISAVSPRMANMLNTLEPMILPSASPASPFRAAATLVASSGSDVPTATTVRPITVSADTERARDPRRARDQQPRPGHQRAEPDQDQPAIRQPAMFSILHTGAASPCPATGRARCRRQAWPEGSRPRTRPTTGLSKGPRGP